MCSHPRHDRYTGRWLSALWLLNPLVRLGVVASDRPAPGGPFSIATADTHACERSSTPMSPRFFDEHLKGNRSTRLHATQPRFPEVMLERGR